RVGLDGREVGQVADGPLNVFGSPFYEVSKQLSTLSVALHVSLTGRGVVAGQSGRRALKLAQRFFELRRTVAEGVLALAKLGLRFGERRFGPRDGQGLQLAVLVECGVMEREQQV